MDKFVKKIEVRDREAWVIACCVRICELAVGTSGWSRVTAKEFNRIFDYLKGRYGTQS